MKGLCSAASGSVGAGTRLASGEAFEEPFEPGHALAQIGDVAAHAGDARADGAPEHEPGADDGDEESDGVDVHSGTVARGGWALAMEAAPRGVSERERVR